MTKDVGGHGGFLRPPTSPSPERQLVGDPQEAYLASDTALSRVEHHLPSKEHKRHWSRVIRAAAIQASPRALLSLLALLTLLDLQAILWSANAIYCRG